MKNFDMKSYMNSNNQNEIQEDIYDAEKLQEFISTLKNEFQSIGNIKFLIKNFKRFELRL